MLLIVTIITILCHGYQLLLVFLTAIPSHNFIHPTLNYKLEINMYSIINYKFEIIFDPVTNVLYIFFGIKCTGSRNERC